MAKRGPPPHAGPRHGIALMIGIGPQFATEPGERDEDDLNREDEPEHEGDARFAREGDGELHLPRFSKPELAARIRCVQAELKSPCPESR